MVEKSYYEEIFQRCKESVHDVAGWKIFIFLPQNFLWRAFIAVTVVFTFMFRSFEYFYNLTFDSYNYVEMFFTVLYFFDTIWATLHVLMVNTRKLRHGTKRHWIFLIIDYISLMPFQLFYRFFVYTDANKHVANIVSLLRINVCLRMYQLPLLFREARYWVYKMKDYFTLVFMEIVAALITVNHLFSCLFFCQLPESVKKTCMENPMNCVIEVELLTFSFLSQSYVAVPFSAEIYHALSITIVFFLIGYFMMYGLLLPLLYFTSYNCLLRLINFTTGCEQLNLLLDNLETTKLLKETIVKYFQTIWTYGKGKRKPESFKVFPICIQKSIFLDVHWDAFNHSDFFADITLGCKRSLALCMRTEFILPNTVLLDEHKKKTRFIYLESGLLQVMAQENNTSPVITFSGGTVLGELSLFYHVNSNAVLQTGQFCVVHYLDHKSFLRVLLNYPSDMRKVFKRMTYRIAMARATNARKTKIFPHFVEDVTSIANDKGNIKWIKQQYRAVSELQKTISKEGKNFENQSSSSHRQIHNSLHTQLEHTSIYLSLIVVNDEVINKYEAVCLRTSLPWFIDPKCHFLKFWNRVIIFIIFVTLMTYPAFMGWFPVIPMWFFSFTVFVNFMYTIDLFLSLFTALKYENVVTTSFEVVLFKRLSSLSFYMDLIAALPLQLLVDHNPEVKEPYVVNLYLFNAFAKSYRLIRVLNEWNYKMSDTPTKRTVLKHVLCYFTAIYMMCMIYKLTGIECVLYDCGDNDWYSYFEKEVDEKRKYRDIASVYLVVYFGFDLPNDFFRTDRFISYALYLLSYLCFRLYYFEWVTEIVASYVAERMYSMKYAELTDLVYYFMRTRHVTGRVAERVKDTMRFQWYYDRGNYLSEQNRIIDDIPSTLKVGIDKQSLFRTLRLCPFFEMEDEDFIWDLCRLSQRIALPANSVLITFGNQTMCMYLIHKGFVQINSFLLKDAVNNVGKPFVLSSGNMFPVIVAFNQYPSVVTARTVTDCELIILQMEDILKEMIAHQVLKDAVEALKSTDLKPLRLAKPGVSIVNQTTRDVSSEIFRPGKFKRCFRLVKWFLYDKAINSDSKVYLYWEIFRVSCIVFSLFSWPFIYSCLTIPYVKHLACFLLVIDSTVWIDLYLRLRLSFYNSKGLTITHPLERAQNYLFTSFIMDAISIVPYVLVIRMLHQKNLEYGAGTVLIHMAMRFASVYKLHGLITYLAESKRLVYQMQVIEYLLLFVLLCNTFVDIRVFIDVSAAPTPVRNFKKMTELYFQKWTETFRYLMKINSSPGKISVIGVTELVVLSLSGWIMETLNYAFIMLHFLASDKQASKYRYYLQSFVKYLSAGRIEEKNMREAVNYYEHLWEETKGIDFKSVFSRFPNILHEDLLHSVYRVTLSTVSCFSKANEGFYRALSRHIREIYMEKGSVILFEGQVKSDVFFVHKGRCEVQKVAVVLHRGSMIGDIRRQGLMYHTITAKTHVVLLNISSDVLFLQMDNFADTKDAYEKEVFKYEDFVQSTFVDTSEMDEHEVLPQKPTTEDEESKFEPLGAKDPTNEFRSKASGTMARTSWDKEEKMENSGFIDPGSLISRALNALFLLDALLTVFLVPLFVGIRSLALVTLIVIYVLDAIWVVKILATLRTAVVNTKTGILNYKKTAIFYNYLYRLDGFVTDLISITPFELVPFLRNVFMGTRDCFVLFYLPRTLRFLHIITFSRRETKRLSANLGFVWLFIVTIMLVVLNFFVCFVLMVEDAKDVELGKCYRSLSWEHFYAVRGSYMCVINCFCGGGLNLCKSKNSHQVFLETVIAVWGAYAKASLFVQTVSVISRIQYSKFEQMKHLEELENYVVVRNISPSLLNQLKAYFVNLYGYCHEGGMPTFLKSAPDYIKFHVMSDLYLHHLTDCFIFRGVNKTFLTQLSTRLERFIFFPGNYVAKQGDIDRNIYFINQGEVYCLESDKDYALLEKPVDLYKKDDYFGVLQGLYPNYPHQWSYRAKTLAEILVLNFNAWEDMRMVHLQITKKIYRNSLQRKVAKDTEEYPMSEYDP